MILTMLGVVHDIRPLLRGTDFDDDVKQARALLSEEIWLFEEFQVFDKKRRSVGD